MVIMLDANALVDDTRFEKSAWTQLTKAIEMGTTRVVVPDIAVREARRRYATGRDKMAREIRSRAQNAPTLGRDLVMQGADAVVKDGLDYDPAPLLRARGATLVPAPDIDHETVADRAIQRVPPFDKDGNGYRDTLHWFSFLELLRGGYGNEHVLVTNDNAFYADTGGEDRLRPHPELMAEAASALGIDADSPELDQNVRFLRNLSELEVPHQYEGDPYDPGYDDAFALFLMNQECKAGGALDLSVWELGWRGWDSSDPHITQGADLLHAEARRLSFTDDIEIRFEVTGDVTYVLTRYEQHDDTDPDIILEQRTRTIIMTGRAIVPNAGPEYMTIIGAEARRFHLSGSGSDWMTGAFDSKAAWQSINKQLTSEILVSTARVTADIASGSLVAAQAAMREAMRSPLPKDFNTASLLELSRRALEEQLREAARFIPGLPADDDEDDSDVELVAGNATAAPTAASDDQGDPDAADDDEAGGTDVAGGDRPPSS